MRLRRGMLLFEVIVALAVLMTALSIGLAALGQASAAKKLQAQREAAREALTLALERIRVLAPEAFPKAGEKKDLGLPPLFASRLPGGNCLLSTSAPGQSGVVRARVEVTWRNLRGGEDCEAGEVLLRTRP